MAGGEAPGGVPRLTLYGRGHCHLCEEMAAQLRGLAARCAFALEVVHVDGNPDLERRFGELVPLLMHGERELARWRLDGAALRAYLAEIG